MSIDATLTPYVPSFKNHFGVSFHPNDNYQSWHLSPYYIPPKEQDLINKCTQTYTTRCEQNSRDFSETIFYRYPDPFSRCLALLDPKELANFSQISQCCYLATKINSIWELQFEKLFPQVKIKEKSCFSTEQQFKIYFHHLNMILKPYKQKLQRNNNLIICLRGSHGNDGKIEKIRKKYQECGGKQAREKYQASNVIERIKDSNHNGFNALLAHKNLEGLTCHLEQLVGKNYDGTPDSIAEDSQQKRCLEAINRFIPSEFNNQQRFTACIQNAEKKIGNKVRSKEGLKKLACH